MATRNMIAVDGNEAAASVAHRVSEVCAIYPITSSSDGCDCSRDRGELGTAALVLPLLVLGWRRRR